MLHSFAIHEVQCRAMFEKWENQKPPKDRRRCPDDPMRGYDPKMSMKELDKLNTASQQTWSEQALVRCQNCNRTFLPEKVPIHQRSCTSSNPAKRIEDSVSSRDIQSNGKLQGASRFQSNSTGYDDIEPEYININCGNMMQCRNCGRSFNAVSYSKHAKVCAKVFTKSRKVFNSAKQRMQGTELEEYSRQAMRKGSLGSTAQRRTSSSGTSVATQSNSGTTGSSIGGNGAPGPSKQAIPKWKLDSMKFRQAMKAAREVSRAEKESKATGVPLHLLLPPTKSSRSSVGGFGGTAGYGGVGGGDYDDPPDGLRCPTCGRIFNQKAGERHIPQCKNIINKPSRLTKGSGAPSYSTSSPEGKGSGGGTFGSTARTLGTTVGGSAAKQDGRYDYDFGPTEVSGRSFRGSSGGGGVAAVRSGSMARTVGGRGNSISGSGSRPGSAGMLSDRFAPSASNRSSTSSTGAGLYSRGGVPPRYATTTAMATSASARPSPRVAADPRAARGSFSGGISGGTGAAAVGGSGGGGYRISQSNVTSRDNPILGHRY